MRAAARHLMLVRGLSDVEGGAVSTGAVRGWSLPGHGAMVEARLIFELYFAARVTRDLLPTLGRHHGSHPRGLPRRHQ